MIPAALRRELGLGRGRPRGSLRGGRLILEPRREVLRRLRTRYAALPEGTRLSREQHGIDTEGLEFDLQALGVEIRPFDVAQARVAAEMWTRALRVGLSLGDRACLALAEVAGGLAVTTDRSWATAKRGVAVRVIR